MSMAAHVWRPTPLNPIRDANVLIASFQTEVGINPRPAECPRGAGEPVVLIEDRAARWMREAQAEGGSNDMRDGAIYLSSHA
jgi:hypothetical protein